MRIFPLLLIIYVSGIVLMRASDPSAIWTNGQLFWLNGGALALLSVLFGDLAIRAIRWFPERFRVAVLAILIMTLYAGAAYNDRILAAISRLTGAHLPVAAVMGEANTSGSAALERHWDGHFRADATINGRTVDMLVDTGASLVLLTHEDALAAGLNPDALDYSVPILTANGKSHVATITLRSVRIGDVEARNVRGAVAKPGMLHASLLGMSFLGEIREAIIRKDSLILHN